MRAAAGKVARAQSARGQLPDRLNGIAKESHPRFTAQVTHLAPRLKNRRLVVRRHQRHGTRLLDLETFPKPADFNHTGMSHRHQHNPAGKPASRRRHHTGMFNRRKPDGGIARKRLSEVMEHGIRGLRRARGPHDVHRIASQVTRQFLPRRLQRCIRSLAEAMRTRWVADKFFRRLKPHLTRLRQHRSGRVVIEVEHGRRI